MTDWEMFVADLQRFVRSVRRLFCRHNRVRVRRWHPDVLAPDQRGKTLYVDVYKVHNLVQCLKCEAWLDGSRDPKAWPHYEHLYEEQEPK